MPQMLCTPNVLIKISLLILIGHTRLNGHFLKLKTNPMAIINRTQFSLKVSLENRQL